MKASAHRGLVVVDIAAVERDCATIDDDATSILPNNKARQSKRAPHRGDGLVSCVGSSQLTLCEHTREPCIARQ